MSAPFVHMELSTPDLAAAKKFYGELCGWSFDDVTMPEFGTYAMFRPDSGPGGGMFTMQGAPTTWLPYINTDSVEETVAKATELGATVIRPKTEVPGHGWFAILTDPTGATIAFWEQAKLVASA